MKNDDVRGRLPYWAPGADPVYPVRPEDACIVERWHMWMVGVRTLQEDADMRYWRYVLSPNRNQGVS